jgi:ribosome-associated translation inhibitor RaiA
MLSVVSNDVEEKHALTTKKNTQKVEAVLQCKKNQIIKSEVSCDDMYSSIDVR